ncbi:xanthine dehydrogenase family protein molybdopterin-binding subunit [Treponema zioleckii]|uniref:xanthine dehydrogenase family protein molybdopterin-binding subunit n=1 Tax=Treponema zioleckii TaxID=331680 RepID=UPI00168B162F|nr:xanthine dehydrogenase family protein [Treponema zioleckii]
MYAKKLLSGRGKKLIFVDDFYTDIDLENMLYAFIIRSPFPFGKFISVQFPQNVKIPDDCAIFTYKDIPAKKTVSTLGLEIPLFCDGTIRYKGEPLGILVGRDKEFLEDILDKLEIKIDFEDLNQKINEFKVKNLNQTFLFEKKYSDDFAGFSDFKIDSQKKSSFDEESSRVLAKRIVRVGSAEENPVEFNEIFTNSPHVVKNTWSTCIRSDAVCEPDGAVCYEKNGSLHVFAPSQWLTHLRTAVSEATGIEPEKIVVSRTKFSVQNTNALWHNGIVSAQTAIACLKTGCPVKLVLSRKEQQEFIENTARVTIKHSTAVSNEGEILAMNISISLDAGYFNPFAQEIIDRLVIASCGVYQCKNVRIVARAFSSQNPPASVNISSFDAPAFFAIENQMQKIAEIEEFVSPLDLRLKNLFDESASKEERFFPFKFELGRSNIVLSKVCELSDFYRKYVAHRINKNRLPLLSEISPFAPPLRGIGLSCAFEGGGFFGTDFLGKNVSLETTLREDGKLEIHSLPPSDTIWNVWIKTIQEVLGLERSSIVLNSNFPLEDAPEEPETIRANIGISTYLLRKCCEAIKRHKNGELPYTVEKSISAAKMRQWNKKTFSGTPFNSTAFAAITVEIEIDPCTYKTKILDIYVVADAGKILNVIQASSSLKLAIQQCLANLVEGETVPADKIKVALIQSDDEPKMVAHLIESILPAAYSSALSQALGKTVESIPLKNDTIYNLCATI